MKNKKVYIGIATILTLVVISIVCILLATSRNKDVKQLSKNVNIEDTKQAMENTEESKEELNNANEEEEKIEEEIKAEEKAEEKVEEKAEEKAEEKKEEPVVKTFEVTPLEKTMYVTASSLNVRTGPDTSYSSIGSIAYSGEASITGQTGEWYRISYNSRVGYVKGSYLSDTKPEPKQEEVEHVANYGEGTVESHVIIINSRNNTLRYYRDGNLFRSYSCATGAGGTPTPQGKFAIFEKLVNRPYYKTGIAGGAPNNPLGKRWMQFKSGGYAIHGTNNESSIGGNVSHGCVRMHNAEVEELYDLVPYGTIVIVKSTSMSDQDIAASYGITLN